METKNSRLRFALAALADMPREDWEALAQERQAGASVNSSSKAPEAGEGAAAEVGSGTQQVGTGSGGAHTPETVQQQGAAALAAASKAGDGEDGGSEPGDGRDAASMVASERGYSTALPTPSSGEGAASPQVPTPEAAGGVVGTGAHTLDAAGSSTGRQSPAYGASSS